MAKYMMQCIGYDENDEGFRDLSVPIKVTEAGFYYEENYDEIVPSERDRRKGRLDYHLCYVKNGKIEFTVDGETYLISKGGFLIPPGTPYYYKVLRGGDGYGVYWIHFTGSEAEAYLRRLQLLDWRVFYADEMEEVVSLIESIVRELTFKMENYEDATSALLWYMLALFARKLTGAQKKNADVNSKDVRMQRTLEHIYLYYRRDIPIKELAEMCDLSPSRFSALFKKNFGMFPHQFIIQYRLKKASELLLTTNASIAEVADACGFEDPLYFSRIFKKRFGISPTGYRSAINQEVYNKNFITDKDFGKFKS